MPDEILEHIIGLYSALEEDNSFTISNPNTPKNIARNSNKDLRSEMSDRNNYYQEIEKIAQSILNSLDYPVQVQCLSEFLWTCVTILDFP